jgi:hypothetical protein
MGELAGGNTSARSGTAQASGPSPYSPECLEEKFCELPCTEFSEVRNTKQSVSQDTMCDTIHTLVM